MDVVPGNVVHAGEAEVVRLFQRRLRSLHDAGHRGDCAQPGACTRNGLDAPTNLASKLGSTAFARIKQDQYFGHACKIPETTTTTPRSALLLWE